MILSSSGDKELGGKVKARNFKELGRTGMLKARKGRNCEGQDRRGLIRSRKGKNF